MEIAYKYKRKDGGETYCYGEILEDSNFEITCEFEDCLKDGVACDIDTDKYNTWKKICEYLENNYSTVIGEIESC